MKHAKKTMVLSAATLCLAAGLLVGGTYALFTDTHTVNNHLQAGTLDVGLERVSYQTHSLKSDGTMSLSDEDLTVVNLAEDNATLFSFNNAVPTTWAQAKIKVSNLGDVAFSCGVKMIWNANGDATPQEEEFAKQIQITITAEEQSKQYMLYDCAKEINLFNDMYRILADSSNPSKEFTVKAEFKDDENNNSVQTISLDFDMQVYATQLTN